MNIEGTLLEKLRKIEALHAGTTVDGEREAARGPRSGSVRVSPSFARARRTSTSSIGCRTPGSAGSSSPCVVGMASRPIGSMVSATAR
jgi:hypothetical protein